MPPGLLQIKSGISNLTRIKDGFENISFDFRESDFNVIGSASVSRQEDLEHFVELLGFFSRILCSPYHLSGIHTITKLDLHLFQVPAFSLPRDFGVNGDFLFRRYR